MKRITLSLLACAALALPAHAQNFLDLPSWQHWNLSNMTTDEEARINAGTRNGSLTAAEANKLRDRLSRINALKSQLSRGGMSMGERTRLDNEIDKLAEKIYKESNDNQRSRWLGNKPWDWARSWRNDNNYNNNFNNLSSWQHWNLNTMTEDEQARINAGLRNGSLTQAEATQLQSRLNQINNLKATLSAGGLSMGERQRLDNELDSLSQQIFRETGDGERNSRWLGSNPYDWANKWKNNNRVDKFGKKDWKDAKRAAKNNDWKDGRNNWQDGKNVYQDARRDQRQDWHDDRKDGKDDWQDARRDSKDTWQDARKDSRDDWQDARKDASKDERKDWKKSQKGSKDTWQDGRKDGRESFQDARKDSKDSWQDTKQGGRDAWKDSKGDSKDAWKDAKKANKRKNK